MFKQCCLAAEQSLVSLLDLRLPTPLFPGLNVNIKQEGPRTYLQHTTKSINQGAMLCTGEKVGEGQLHGAHAGAGRAGTGGPDARAVWSYHHVGRVGGKEVGAIAKQQRKTPGTEVGKAAGQVGRLDKFI